MKLGRRASAPFVGAITILITAVIAAGAAAAAPTRTGVVGSVSTIPRPSGTSSYYMTKFTVFDSAGRVVRNFSTSLASPSAAYRPMVFTPSDPNFYASDGNGDFSAQMTYGSRQGTLAGGFQLSAYLQSIAVSNVTAAGYSYQNGHSTNWHYSKVAGAAYVFHSSLGEINYDQNYQLDVGYTFAVNVNGKAGKAVVSTTFNYVATH